MAAEATAIDALAREYGMRAELSETVGGLPLVLLMRGPGVFGTVKLRPKPAGDGFLYAASKYLPYQPSPWLGFATREGAVRFACTDHFQRKIAMP